MAPEGLKVVGEWTAVGRDRGFMLFESDDPMLVTQFNMAWNDILKSDLMLVLDTEKDLMSVLKG